MAWGDAGVSKRLLLSNGAVAWGVGGVQARIDVPQTGVLRGIRLLHNTGAPTFTPGTGAVALDVQGPFNAYTWFRLAPNSQAPIINVSGFGLSLINDLIFREYMGNTPDTFIVTPVNGEAAADVYNGSATTGTAALNYYQYLPVAQVIRSLGGEVGLFPLQNPAVQLQLYWTPNSTSTATPYTFGSTTAATLPYLLTGNATVTVATPTLEVVRDLWEVPAQQSDYPAFNFVSTWSEETFNNAVVGSTQLNWKATPLSGILVRVIGFISDGGNSLKGIAASSLTASNAVNLTYGAGTAKFAETASDALSRQHAELGHQMKQGAYYYDMLGPNLTLQDSLNLFKVGNVQFQFNVTAALASNSSAKVLRQLIMPLVVQ